MTRGSVREYAAAVRDRYRSGNKMEKGKILDEFVKVTGLHRKAAIRLLNRSSRSEVVKRPGRPGKYGAAVVVALKFAWEASDRLCSKRLQPFLAEIVRVLREHGEQHLDAYQEKLLCQMSPATIDRLLRPVRKLDGRRSLSTTRSGNWLKSSIPIRTFADWQDCKPGFVETDLVAHCGESVEGFYLNTLCAVDVASGWTECLPIWGKGQLQVRGAVNQMRRHLPFNLLGVDSDNGSEFINQYFYNYCHQQKITFTRSRSYKKNDSCHVEQKNGHVIRRLVGYDRYASKVAYECLERLYNLVRLYINFFQPTMKLLTKSRQGAKVYKTYETAQTPYQRLLKLNALNEAKRTELAATYRGLNPIDLLRSINANLEQLWRMADRSINNYSNRNFEAIRRSSVTV
jgi:hypothetical protein